MFGISLTAFDIPDFNKIFLFGIIRYKEFIDGIRNKN